MHKLQSVSVNPKSSFSSLVLFLSKNFELYGTQKKQITSGFASLSSIQKITS